MGFLAQALATNETAPLSANMVTLVTGGWCKRIVPLSYILLIHEPNINQGISQFAFSSLGLQGAV